MKFLVFDTGIGFEHAHRLHQDGNEVFYYINWQSPYPKFEDAILGYGFGPRKVLSFGSVLDRVDWVVFTDVGFYGLADFLRSKGIKCFGGGAIESLENNRLLTGQTLDEVGIPRAQSKAFNDISKLRDFISRDPSTRKIIKVSNFRGNVETFIYTGKPDADIQLTQIEARVGPFKDKFSLVVEEPLGGLEVGVDTWFRQDGTYTRPYFLTLENQNNGATVGRWVESSRWDDNLKKIGVKVKAAGYLGPLSLEGFDDGEKISVIDITMRPCYPGSNIFLDTIKDYGKFISSGAAKLEVQASEFCACGNLFTDDNDKWLLIHTNKVEPRYRRCVKKDGEIYKLPGGDLVATVTMAGSGPEDALRKANRKLQRIEISGGFCDSDLSKGFRQEEYGWLRA